MLVTARTCTEYATLGKALPNAAENVLPGVVMVPSEGEVVMRYCTMGALPLAGGDCHAT